LAIGLFPLSATVIIALAGVDAVILRSDNPSAATLILKFK